MFQFLSGKEPVHLQKAYADFGYRRGDSPCAEKVADQLVSVPMFPELTPEQIEYVCATIHEFFCRGLFQSDRCTFGTLEV